MFESLTWGFLYSLAKDGASFVRRVIKRQDPAEIVKLRNKWKAEFTSKIFERHQKRLRRDVIVRDMKRIDAYPNLKDEKGISPWFRVALLGTYHRGILLGLGFESLVEISEGKWRRANYKLGEQGDIRAVLVGRVRYEDIESVDWDGDEYYGYPHIYCLFRRKKEPYEDVGFYTENFLFEDALPFYTLIVSQNDVV
jgi:hypothetical protein